MNGVLEESGIVVVAVEWINATKEGRQVEMEYSVCSEREGVMLLLSATTNTPGVL